MTYSLTTPRGNILIREAKPIDAIPFRELHVAVQPALSNRRQDEQIPQIAAENTVLQAF